MSEPKTLTELLPVLLSANLDAELMNADAPEEAYISVMMPDPLEPDNPIEAYIHPHPRGRELFTVQYWQFGETIDVTAFNVEQAVHLLTTPDVRDAAGAPAWCECRWHRA